MARAKLGDEVKSSLYKNCLLCSRFMMCRDPNKDASYACTKFSNESPEESIRQMQEFAASSNNNSELIFDDDNNGEDEILAAIDKIIESGETVSPDLRINDKDILRPKNFVEWATDSRFLFEENQPPFAKQVQLATHMFSEWCPNCSDVDYIENIPYRHSVDKIKERVVFLENGKCPECGAKKAELINDGELRDHTELVAICGQRSGKSISVTLMESYNIARWLTTTNISKSMGILPTTVLVSNYTALTFKQAKDNLWRPLKSIFDTSPWYRTYHEFLTEQGYKLGQELFNKGEESLHYAHRNIFLAPMSPSKRSMRGYTRIGACLVGNSLVATDRGLMPIKENLKGLTTYYGQRPRVIKKSWSTGFKDTIVVHLVNGMKLQLTPNHQVKTVNEDLEFEWVPAKDLENKHIVVSYGWGLPEEPRDLSKYESPSSNVSVREQATKIMYEMKSFQLRDIQEYLGGYSGITATTSLLVRGGFLNKSRIGLQYFYSTNNTYENAIKVFGERGLIKSRRDNTTYPKETSWEFGWLIGSLVADGSYISDIEFAYNSSNKEKIDLTIECLQQLFNYTPTVTETKLSSGIPFYKVHIGVREIKQFLRWVGLLPSGARKKTIPWSILQSDIKTVKGFIASLFLHDGSQRYNRMIYWTKSSKLAREVQLLLLSAGFSTRVKKSEKKLYSVRILGKSAKKLSKWLGLSDLPDKYSFQDTFSNSILETDDAYENPYLRIPFYRHYSKTSFYLGRNNQQAPDVVKEFENHKGILIVPVSHITNGQKREVFDLEVDHKSHAFTANGLVVHNSVDELGWYPYGQTKAGKDFERLDAKEVYTALKRSLTTVKNAYEKQVARGASNAPKPLMMNISSPSSVNDMIMTLYNRHSRNLGSVYTVKYPTWKFNPEYRKKSFDEEYRTNPVEAERDFGCNPPISVNAWLKDEKVALKAFGDKRNALEVTSGRYKTKSSKVLTSANHEIKLDYWPEYGAILCLDAGLSNNSFAFAIIAPSNIPDEDSEDATVAIDVYAVGEIIPRQDAPVSFTHVYKNILMPLCNELPIAAVISDRWQNIKMLQDLEESTGVDYFEWRLKYNDFKVIREGLYEGKINLNKLEMDPKEIISTTLDNYPHCFNTRPVSHLYYQLLTVQDTGNAIIKGDGTDDIFRCIALGYTALQDPTVLEIIDEFNASEEIVNEGIGAVATGSRGNQQQATITGTGGAGIGIRLNTTQSSNVGASTGIGASVSRSGR